MGISFFASAAIVASCASLTTRNPAQNGGTEVTIPASKTDQPVILVIGDSHLGGAFGDHLYEKLRTIPNAKVYLYSSCGTIVENWYTGKKTTCDYFYKGPEYSEARRISARKFAPCHDCLYKKVYPTPIATQLLSDIKPTLVIVEHGTNYAGYDDWTDQTIVHDMQRLAVAIHATGAKCIWAGLPDSRAYNIPDSRAKYDHNRSFTSLQNHLAALVQDATIVDKQSICEFIDSTKLTTYPKDSGDSQGVHYFSADAIKVANKWADSVFTHVK